MRKKLYRRFSRLIPPARQCGRSDRERILCSGEGPLGWAVVKAHVSVLRGSAGRDLIPPSDPTT